MASNPAKALREPRTHCCRSATGPSADRKDSQHGRGHIPAAPKDTTAIAGLFCGDTTPGHSAKRSQNARM
eukprot:4988192-Alexandrium_andersonii.AAC.1